MASLIINKLLVFCLVLTSCSAGCAAIAQKAPKASKPAVKKIARAAESQQGSVITRFAFDSIKTVQIPVTGVPLSDFLDEHEVQSRLGTELIMIRNNTPRSNLIPAELNILSWTRGETTLVFSRAMLISSLFNELIVLPGDLIQSDLIDDPEESTDSMEARVPPKVRVTGKYFDKNIPSNEFFTLGNCEKVALDDGTITDNTPAVFVLHRRSGRITTRYLVPLEFAGSFKEQMQEAFGKLRKIKLKDGDLVEITSLEEALLPELMMGYVAQQAGSIAR